MSFQPLRSAALVAAVLASSIGAAHAGTQSFQVYAKENSLALSSHDASPLDTGITFEAGAALHITASGVWDGGGCASSGPEGVGCYGEAFPGINYYSLVGRVGSGNYFKIGASYDGTADATGHLFLGYVDSDSFNNSGFVTAVVTTPAVPEPETWGLLLGGLGILGASLRKRKGAAA